MSEKVEYSKEWCKVELTQDEMRDIAERLAIKTQELDEVEKEKKSMASSYKERIERVQGEIKTSARLYKDGFEMRDVECVVERDFEAGEVRYIRTDNGLIARRTKITMAERQRRIDEAITDQEGEKEPAEIEADQHQQKIQREMAAETSAL